MRYDYSVANVLPVVMTAPVNANGLLPDVTAPGVDNALTFNLPQPRVGVTYSLDERRKTQLRATYAMFTSQIGTGAAGFLSVAQYRGFYVDAKDLNGDHVAQPNEFLWNTSTPTSPMATTWLRPGQPQRAADSQHPPGRQLWQPEDARVHRRRGPRAACRTSA